MADYSDLDPTALRRSVSDGTRLKKSITTDLYTGGTPTAANQVKRSIMYADGTLKESIANASGLKPSWLVAGGGGGGAWSPSDLGADLLAWYDASDAGTVTESAGSVSQWDDKSGNNRHVSQGSGANQPTYNGTNEVDFDSDSSQYLFNSSPFMYNNGSADMYIVGSAIVTAFGSIVAEGSSSSGNPIYVPMETGSSTVMSTYARNDGGTTMLSHPAIFTASGIWDDAQKLYDHFGFDHGRPR